MANQPKKYKKFVATAATATLVASAIVPVASAASLSDIKGNTHEEAINALVDAKVISGYPDGTFKPNKTLTRSDVVKLLGKYLVSQGHSIPTDAVSNPRFSDLTSKSNKELLEYAAVVADAGVFAGSNGKLLAGDQITRENMAIVLVRMINTLKDVSLEEFVASQNFNGDVKDLNVAKAEARTAIQVLDFYDITNPSVANFNPKGNTTRGQFATFLHKTINSDFAGAAATTGTVKAINATTVEVTFSDAVDNVNALKFAIEGLEVKNASVKQTDAKTVVLTTAAQEANKEYTVTLDGVKLGTFKGVNAAVPTKVTIKDVDGDRSHQGVIGNEVTVRAEVTVADGQSKAGIPVTFNVVNNNSNTNEKIEKVAYTDANGVATYSYTRYYASTDDVTAYATSKSSVNSTAKVYWANAHQLTIKDITEKTTVTNGDNKVYEINSSNFKNGYVFVAFTGNLDVAPDKIEDGVTVEGNSVHRLNSDGAPVLGKIGGNYPYKSTLGNEQVIAVKLDANGKANLVVSGTNASAKPVVYEGKLVGTSPSKTNLAHYDATYSATALQAHASEVKFDKVVNYGLTIKAQGVRDAAVSNTNGTGGRDYEIAYTKADGKPVAKGTTVYVAIPTKGLSSGTNFQLLNEDEETVGLQSGLSTSDYNVYALSTDKDGKVLFTVTARNAEDYVQPIAFLNDNKPTGSTFFDKDDTQASDDVTYFTNSVTYASSLALVNSTDKKQTSFAAGHEAAKFSYRLVDQNGKVRKADKQTQVTFSVSAGEGQITAGNEIVHPHQTKTITRSLEVGQSKVDLTVNAQTPTTVNVYATSSQAGFTFLPTESLVATFTNTSIVNVNGTVTNVNKTDGIVTVNGVPYNLNGATYLNQGTAVPTLSAFYDHLTAGKYVSITKDADGKLVFNIIQAPAPTPTLVTKAEVTADDTVKVTFSGAVNASPTASQFAIDFNGNGTIESNEYATAASGSSTDLTLTFATVHNLSTSTVTVPNLQYTPTTAGTLLSVASTNVTTAFTTPVTVAKAAHGVTVSTTNTAGVAAEALTNTLSIPTGKVVNAGNMIVSLQADKAGVTSPINVPVAVTLLDDEKAVASKIATELNKLTALTSKFTIVADDADVVVTAKDIANEANTTLVVDIADQTDAAYTSIYTADFDGITSGVTGSSTAGSIGTLAVTNATFTNVTGTGTVAPLKVKVLTTGGSTLVDTDVTVSVLAGETGAQVAAKVKTALEANATIAANYTVTVSGAIVTLTNKVAEVQTTTITVE
ncbi:Surface layer protein [Solibacillus isronensis B3W22]|uniref:Surface layer protein n=1 Tax=Solibacillus isronensis B3W22 TaxID=1224748 RepID=K1KU34_9BACL|nr:S-layer homology domain-containing protein [Solibacillus isronensis]AMO84320.1 hypothetical protein SOLI23_01700 [Solibacillus silvestris]EKB46051.1 Surface layer protein [Solibacillus isronensis B3W22]